METNDAWYDEVCERFGRIDRQLRILNAKLDAAALPLEKTWREYLLEFGR